MGHCEGVLPAPMPLLPDAIYYPSTPPLSAVEHQAGAYPYRGAIASGQRSGIQSCRAMATASDSTAQPISSKNTEPPGIEPLPSS